MHRGLVLLAAAASWCRAGVVQGVVLEYVSGRPMARAVVRLEPVPQPGSQARVLSMRAGRSGQFAFSTVAPGSYLLMAMNEGYFPAAYGQRLPAGRGVPFQVTADSEFFGELRLRHKGAITGRVLDENGVGKSNVPVLAYRARLPLRAAGSGTSDDRGVYRIHGLDPGKYWIRSASYTHDDGSGWLPTFAPQSREGREARAFQAAIDTDTMDADVSPEPGTLFHLAGLLGCDTPDLPVLVTLSSETGRRNVTSSCKGSYRFDGLAPGAYEVFARVPDGSSTGFIELFLDRDSDSGTVQLMRPPLTVITVRKEGSRADADVPVTLMGRRQDMSESEPEREITGRRVTLAPGHWEFRARAPRGYYVQSIDQRWGFARRPWKAERADDWFEVAIEARTTSQIEITLSDKPGVIAGRVMAEGKPVAGVPVFLWPAAANARRSVGGSPQRLSDTDGRFDFDSLPPGDYRVLASFDTNEVDEEFMERAGARVVKAEASQTANLELGVWSAPW